MTCSRCPVRSIHAHNSFAPTRAGKRALLHFQAVDHDATVRVNGNEVARHRGGFTSFAADLFGVAEPGE